MGQHEHPTMIDYPYEIMINDVTNVQYADYVNDALSAGKIIVADNKVLGYYPGDTFHGVRHEEKIAAGDWPRGTLIGNGLTVN
jgi:hypothetical protein